MRCERITFLTQQNKLQTVGQFTFGWPLDNLVRGENPRFIVPNYLFLGKSVTWIIVLFFIIFGSLDILSGCLVRPGRDPDSLLVSVWIYYSFYSIGSMHVAVLWLVRFRPGIVPVDLSPTRAIDRRLISLE